MARAFSELGPGAVDVVLVLQRDAEVVMRGSDIRVACDHVAKCADRFVELLLLEVCESDIHASGVVGRVRGQHLLKFRNAFVPRGAY